MILLLSIFIPSIASQAVVTPQVAFYTAEEDILTHHFRGSISNFTPPSSCNSGTLWSTEEDIDSTNGFIWATQSVGCYTSADTACCPPNWVLTENNYYTGNGAGCPPGYKKLPSVYVTGSETFTSSYNLISGTRSAWPCCPTITFSFSKGSTSGVISADECGAFFDGSVGGPRTLLCGYRSVYVEQTYVESGTTFTIGNEWSADPIYIFEDEDEDGNPVTLVTSDASLVSSLPTSSSQQKTALSSSTASTRPPAARPGSSISSMAKSTQTAESTQTPTNSTDSTGNDTKNASGLSTGAAAGIGIGVGVPVVLAAMYFTYWVTRRRLKSNHDQGRHENHQGVISSDIFDTIHNTGMEPGVADYPGGIGGIQSRKS
ncbi:hypothetical protein AA313_de0208630 [Arthrobotrys entomopaga]|nr:hypothetical protein AA313_de0208630 [Arthrobotrys entomopaga]